MAIVIDHTEDQFKDSIIQTFKDQLAKLPNTRNVVFTRDTLDIEVYTKDEPNTPRKIDRLVFKLDIS